MLKKNKVVGVSAHESNLLGDSTASRMNLPVHVWRYVAVTKPISYHHENASVLAGPDQAEQKLAG